NLLAFEAAYFLSALSSRRGSCRKESTLMAGQIFFEVEKGGISMRVKFKKTYYKVTALQDGTILFAFQKRKPVKSSMHPKPQIDEDGIYDWYFEKQEEAQSYSDWGKGVHHSAIVNSLNTKRIIREQVETRLERIESQLVSIAEHLARLGKQ